MGGGLPEAKKKPTDEAKVNNRSHGGGAGDDTAALGGAAGGSDISRQELAEQFGQNRQRAGLDFSRQSEHLAEGLDIGAIESGPNFHADRVGIESLHGKLGECEANFAGKRGIRQFRIGRGRLAVGKFAEVVECKHPAAEFFPNCKRVAIDMKCTRRNVEARGRARGQILVAWRFEKHRKQSCVFRFARDHKHVGELASHRIGPQAETLGVQRGKVGKQRFIIARHAHRHRGERLHREKHRQFASRQIGKPRGHRRRSRFARLVAGLARAGPDFPGLLAGDQQHMFDRFAHGMISSLRCRRASLPVRLRTITLIFRLQPSAWPRLSMWVVVSLTVKRRAMSGRAVESTPRS